MSEGSCSITRAMPRRWCKPRENARTGSDARRFMPSWDEPDYKARFDLTARVPAAQMAVSNMPAASSKALPGGLKEVRFQQTPTMSSYLLFFAAGDFDRVSALCET